MRRLSTGFILPRLISIPLVYVNDDVLYMIFILWTVPLVHLIVVAKTHLSLIFIPEQCLSYHVTARIGLLPLDLSTYLSQHISHHAVPNNRCSFLIHIKQKQTTHKVIDLLAQLYIHRLLVIIIKYKLYIILFFIFNNKLTLITHIISLPH